MQFKKSFLDTEKLFSNEDLCAASKESGVQNIAASKKGGEGCGVLCALHIVHHLEGGVGV